MTNKLVVIINSVKIPKIKKILLYEMKFLVPKYSYLQNPSVGGLPPPDPRSLCPLSSTEFVDPHSPPRTKFLGTPLAAAILEGIRQLKFELLPHVTYSAEPAPSDYPIFGALKEASYGWKI